MQKILLFVISGLFLTGVALTGMASEKTDTAAKPGIESMSGVIIDNACAGGHQADLAEFVKTHTKDCALMPNCQASGYSLYLPDGQLLGFSKKSNTKIVKYLKGTKNTLNVELKVKKAGKELELVSIKNKA